MKVKLVKFRDILSERIEKFGGVKDSCVKAGEINVWSEDEDEELMITSISGGEILSKVNIYVKRYKGNNLLKSIKEGKKK